MTDRPAPYAADTRARGWRFEMDVERIRQSDTWALAAAEVRPWLLMLWCEAWSQTPCGSLPSDDDVLCARLGIPPKLWAKHRKVLMRGWWQADDGRMYHPTITELVRDMLERKDSERQRKAAYRARMEAERAQASGNVPRDKTGTDAGQTRESGGRDGTGTGTGTGTGLNTRPTPHNAAGAREVVEVAGHEPTPAGIVCRALRQAGIERVNPAHPDLQALLAAGATEAELLAIAPSAIGKGDPFAWLLVAAKNRRKQAAQDAEAMHHGRLPNRQESLEARNRAVADAWLRSEGVVT